MPVTLTYPGVYIEEIPSGVRTITGVATSITAFIGRALRGPVNTPTTINSYGDFERTFGGLDSDYPLSFSVKDFFLNGGSQAIIVRLYHPTAVNSDYIEAAHEAAFATAKAAKDLADKKDAADAVASAARAEATSGGTSQEVADAASVEAAEYTESPAKEAAQDVADAAQTSYSNGDTADQVATAAETQAATYDTTSAAVAAAARATVPTDDPNDPETHAKYEASNDVATAAETEAADTSSTYRTVADAAVDEANDVAPLTKAKIILDTEDGSDDFYLEAAYEGSWGNYLKVRVDYDVKIDSDTGLPYTNLFNLFVYDEISGSIETFRNVSVETSNTRRVDKVLENESKLIRILESMPSSRPEAHADAPSGKSVWADNDPATNTSVTYDNEAADGETLDINDFTGTGKQGNKEGLYALEKADLFNLLCIPPEDISGDIDTSLIDQAASYCESRRAFFIIDPPSTWTDKDSAKSGISEITTSKNAAIFFPRLVQANPLKENQLESFVPCGAVAGIFAKIDAQRGVWKAPAGLETTLSGVPKLTVPLTDAENGELNPLGINCIRALPAAGRVLWGSRTRQGDDRLASEWKYIPVRRLTLYLEESLYRGTQWAVFEPNDTPLWSQLRLNLGSFMHSLFRQGAFQGSSPKEAYFVKCDSETTTQDDINKGIVNVVVGFAPLKPAEFVVIKIQQMAGEVES